MAWIALLIASANAQEGSVSVLLYDVHLVDGTSRPPQSRMAVLIEGDRIAWVGPESEAPASDRALNLRGHTLLPGLIDAHVHLGLVGGSEHRGDEPDQLDWLRKQHLRAYLACGVTTVLDMGIADDDLARLRAWQAEGAPSPRVLSLGAPLGVPGGYGEAVLPELLGVDSPAAVEARLDALVDASAAGVKLLIEPGFGRAIWPMHSADVLDAVRDGVAERALPLFVHATSADGYEIGMGLAPHAFAHPPRKAREASALADALAATGAYVISTISVADRTLYGFEPERAEDATVRRVVPTAEINTALDPAAQAAALDAMIEMAEIRAPDFLRTPRPTEWITRRTRSQMIHSVGMLYDAGVPIVLGSDAGALPMSANSSHGVSSLEEVELLVEAGLSPAAALAAGTRVAAEMLGMKGEVGTIEVGAWADMIVVQNNPLANIEEIRGILYVIAGGEVRTPEAWMRD